MGHIGLHDALGPQFVVKDTTTSLYLDALFTLVTAPLEALRFAPLVFGGMRVVGPASRAGAAERTALVGVLRARELSLRVGTILKPGGRLVGEASSSASIRTLQGGAREAEALFGQVSAGGRAIGGTSYPGTLVELPGVGRVGLRPVSASGPPTIDVFIEGLGISKIKFVP
jgi:hypothetical protein